MAVLYSMGSLLFLIYIYHIGNLPLKGSLISFADLHYLKSYLLILILLFSNLTFECACTSPNRYEKLNVQCIYQMVHETDYVRRAMCSVNSRLFQDMSQFTYPRHCSVGNTFVTVLLGYFPNSLRGCDRDSAHRI